MPTYEYQCQDCGEHLEVFQKFSDKPLRVHPECGGKLQKVFHASGVVFKGSGYYVTDSRSKASAAKPPKSANGGSSTGETKTESKSESKSETTSESPAASD